MEIFLCSLGWGVLLKVLLPCGSFSLTAFFICGLTLALEPALFNYLGLNSALYFSLTLIGGLVLALILSLAAERFLLKVRRLAWRILRPHDRSRLNLAPPSRNTLVVSAVCGAFLVILGTAALQSGGAPFWPFGQGNPLAGMLSENQIRRLGVISWPLAMTIWGLSKSLKRSG